MAAVVALLCVCGRDGYCVCLDERRFPLMFTMNNIFTLSEDTAGVCVCPSQLRIFQEEEKYYQRMKEKKHPSFILSVYAHQDLNHKDKVYRLELYEDAGSCDHPERQNDKKKKIPFSVLAKIGC